MADLRTDVLGEVAQIRTTADRRVGDTLGARRYRARQGRGTAGGSQAGAGERRHVDAARGALTGDAKDSLDDLYFDVKARWHPRRWRPRASAR